MRMCKGNLRIQEKLKKLLAAFLAVFMMSSYISLYANISQAEQSNGQPVVGDWLSHVRSYGSKFRYSMNEADETHRTMAKQEKYLFYDTTATYMNLTCIRTGGPHADIYQVVDLYKLKEEEPEVYDILYGDMNMNVDPSSSNYNQYISNYSGDRRYQHILWEISHFYLFTDGSTQISTNETAEDRNRRFNEFNNFINEGVSAENQAQPPFGNDQTISSGLYHMGIGRSAGVSITRYLNEQLIKTLQNELLMIYTNQIYNRKSDVSDFEYMNNTQQNGVNKYGRRIFDAFTDMSKSESYDPSTDHYEYNRGDVTIAKDNTETETPADTSKPFTITNPYKNHATITVKEVRINGNLTDNYTILNENNETITKEQLGNLASTSDSVTFRIHAEDMDTVDVKLNVDYGDIINAQLLIPVKDNGNGTYKTLLTGNEVKQVLININKVHKQYDINSNDEIDRKFDLALTKQIVKTTPGPDSESELSTYKRMRNINIDNLTDKSGNDAKYFMDKSAVTVEPGTTVLYEITVYNEGQIDGFAEKITDYIPAKLQFDPNSEINKKYGWVQESEGVISTEYLSSKINGVQNPNSTNVLKAFNKQQFQEAPVNADGTRDTSVYQTKATVRLELKVLPLTDEEKEDSNNYILDNRAEISAYGYFKDTNGDGVKEFIQANEANKDVDSVQNTAKSEVNGTTASDVVRNIKQRIADTVGSNYSYTDKNNIAYQDDDDIERLRIVEDTKFMDLALRKWIYEVDGESLSQELSRQSIEGIENPRFKNADLLLPQELVRETKEAPFTYSNQKVAVPVKPGSKIVYKIGIYNQGSREGYAEEVTDYLPKGLKLAENSTINTQNGWVETINNDGTRTVKTTKLSKANGQDVSGQLGNSSLENTIKNTNNILTTLQVYTTATLSGHGQNDYLTSYKELMIECEVTDDAVPYKYLTNRAEITKYGYYKRDTFVQCDKPMVDRDSEQDGIKNNLNLDNTYEEWHANYDPGTPFAGNMIDQDDDDFETVYVKVDRASYQLNVVKVDNNEEAISGSITADVFDTKLNGTDMTVYRMGTNDVVYNPVEINSVGEDTILITEVNSPAGYIKTAHKIKLYIERYIDGDIYAAKLTKLELLNDDNSVYKTYTENDMEDFDYVHNGRENKIGKELHFEDGFIQDWRGINSFMICIKNPQLDIALKKSITKVTHNNETKDVKTDNGFNVGRYDNNGNLISITTDVLDRNYDNDHNATYEMNKTPVEVSKGDEVEYEVRLFNEGQIKANASIVTDYIPTGLKVERVYYRNGQTPLTANQNEGNSYTYNETNGELKVYLRDADLIEAYSKQNGLQYDYIRVVCSVKDDAEGVLTNVAEISEYVYETKDGKATTMVDFDSTANNWEAPSNDKASSEWRNYTNNQDILDGQRHAILSQDAGLNNHKGDDDDFDKLIVKGAYELVINKVDETGADVNDVAFRIVRTITNSEHTSTASEVLANNQAASEFTYTEETSPTTALSTITYEIREVANTKYDQVNGQMDLDIKIENGVITGYKLNTGRTNNSYTNAASQDYYLASTMGSQVKVTVTFDSADQKITLKIENKKIADGTYSVKVKKVSADDTSKTLEGVTFSGSKGISTDSMSFTGDTSTYNATTGSNGIATIENEYEINNTNYTKVDKYTISEIDLGNTNSAYTKLNTDLAVFVEKQYNTRTNQYEIKNWYVVEDGINYRSTANNKITNGNGTVKITENNLTYRITASESNGEIVVTVPNMPDQAIELKIVKIDQDTNDPIEGAKMQVLSSYGWLDYTDANGELSSIISVEATKTSIEYRIREISPAAGYDNIFHGKYIKVIASLQNGEYTGITEAKVYNVSDNTEDTAFDTSLFTVAIDPTSSNKRIIVTMKNKITDKVVDLALKKVITEVNGEAVNSSFSTDYNRYADSIDTTPLDNGKNDAIYNLNKTPILLIKGVNVKYQIRIYNESNQVKATASEIKDYIPTGLQLVDVYYSDGTKLTRGTDYTYDETNNVMVTNILNSKPLINEYVPGDPGTGVDGVLSMDYITVECKVLDTASGILTNVAEISEYKTLDRFGTEITVDSDIDSYPSNWENPNDNNPSNNNTTPKNTTEWINYHGDEDNRIQTGVTKSYPGQEDDDDFEKIVVGEVDLVLKKIIVKVEDTTAENFEDQFKRFQNGNINVNPDKMNNIENVTTAEYMLNKTPVPVNNGDTITYQLRIYNEGGIDAKASQIKDYIPKGLDFKKAYYNGTELSEGTDYTISENVLTINLDKQYIPLYNGRGVPSFDDKLTVECKVNGDVRGLLTNVAEISKYKTVYGETDIDRDSETTGNGEWTAPAGSNKNTLDGKSGEPWTNYYNIIEQGEFADYPGQQDDDDFEKILVQEKYKVRIRKVNGVNNNSDLSGIQFKVNDETFTSNGQGIVFEKEVDLKHAGEPGLEPDQYEIEETSVGNFDKLLRQIRFDVRKNKTLTGEVFVKECAIDYLGMGIDRGRIGLNNRNDSIRFTTVETESGDHVTVTLNVIYEDGEYTFELVIANTPKVMEYDVFLNKVDGNGNNVDGVKFNVNSNVAGSGNTVNTSITTQGTDNLVAERRVKSDNYNTVDTYTITEIETVTGLLKLNGQLGLNVTKGLSQDKDKYEIQNIEMTFGNLTSVLENNKYVIKNVPIANTDKTIDITAELVDKTIEYTTTTGTATKTVKAIVVTIPNEPLYEGNYKIQLNKVDQNDENIANVKFAITSENATVAQNIIAAEVTTNGTATPIDIVNATVTKDNYTVSDVYQIEETEVPEAYYKLKDPITVRVEKQINNDKTAYEVQRFYVNDRLVRPGMIVRISGLELQGASLGATVSLTAAVDENNTLLLEVENRSKTGSYIMFIQKVDNYDNMIGGVEFAITGRESNGAVLGQCINTPVTTTPDSVSQIVNRFMGISNVDTEDVFTITETNTPDGYYRLANPIEVKVTKKYGGFGLTVDKVYVNDTIASVVEAQYLDLVGTDKKAKLAVWAEGQIIAIKIENIIKDGSYGIDLIKVDENDNYLANTKFEITGKDSDNTVLTANIPTAEVTTDGTSTPKTVVAARIDATSVEKVDTYSIKEIEVPDGYYKLKNALEVKFEKEVSASGDEYLVKRITVNGTEIGSEEVTIRNLELENAPRDITAVLTAKVKEGNVLELKVQNIPLTGAYLMYLNKVDENGANVTGATFQITATYGEEDLSDAVINGNVTTNGGVQQIVDRFMAREDVEEDDIYTIKETSTLENYFKLSDSIVVRIEKDFGTSDIIVKNAFVKVGNGQEQKVTNGRLVIEDIKLDGTDKTATLVVEFANGNITITVENKLKEFDLSLRKFITKVNNGELTGDKSREPKVSLDTLINGDPKKNGEKTATYEHTKEPIMVSPLDLVEYTLRIYNEGEMDGYARRIIDDVPAGVTMVAPKYNDNGTPANINAEYRWKMFKEISEQELASVSGKEVITYADKYYVETENASEAVIISTDYLSKANGEGNLLKAFDGETLDSKDIKVQFKVKKENEPNKIITNYAQISEHETISGIPVVDRDSTPNKWVKDEDDQDIENLTVTWFDLALYKWVSSTVVTEDGVTKEYASGHTQDDKNKIVNVTVAEDKLDKTVVKFKWTVKVENQGTIEGYAKELKDHVPQGLKFVEADNTEYGWKLQEDGTVTTDYLKDTLLQPGETAEVTLVLTWINGKNNLGAKVNNAEISKDYNKYGTPDIDSTPNNFTGKPIEDDEDVDEVRLNIKTGNGIEMAYVTLGLMVIIVIAAGVYGIKKYVM